MICLSFYVYLTTSIIVLGYEAYKDRINTRWIFIDSLTALFIYYLCKNKLYYPATVIVTILLILRIIGFIFLVGILSRKSMVES
jgi:hypothetical protein